MDLKDACGEDPQLFCESVFEWTSSETAARIADWFVDRPLRIAFIVVVAWVVSRLVRQAIAAFTERLVRDPEIDLDAEADAPNLFERSVDRLAYLRNRRQRARQRALTLEAVLKSISAAVIWIIAGLLILGELGINLAPLIASAGIAGIAIGFGAQSMVRDFLAGMFIIIEDQYGVGDIIDAGEAVGTVEEVTLRTTRLRDLAGVLWTIPNGEIRRVGNMSQLWSRSVLDIEVAYDTDIDVATQVIKDVLDGLWNEKRRDATIIEEPQVLGIETFGADSITIRAVVKTEPAEQFTVARVIRGELKKAFDQAQIEIPFPQRTVWLRSED
ncbi:MAG: mechanosensitive ion channel family protein [Acidimicrobiales bacterium]